MFREKMMILLFCGLLGFLPVYGQYYYQDIYKTFLTNQQYQNDLSNAVQQIQILSFDAQQQPTPGFECHKTLSPDNHKTITFTQSFSTGKDYLTSLFDKKGRVTHTIDSSSSGVSHTFVHYNTAGKIDQLKFISYAQTEPNNKLYLYLKPDTLRETHSFYYDSTGILEKMTRQKKGRAHQTIYFQTDNTGNIFKEYVKEGNKPVYYYKYKDQKLTDIFHYNQHQKKMIPDYLFDYNGQGLLSQKTVVLANTPDYIEWHYTYNDKGQVTRQEGYDKNKQKQTTLVYRYSYLR